MSGTFQNQRKNQNKNKINKNYFKWKHRNKMSTQQMKQGCDAQDARIPNENNSKI